MPRFLTVKGEVPAGKQQRGFETKTATHMVSGPHDRSHICHCRDDDQHPNGCQNTVNVTEGFCKDCTRRLHALNG